jgi:hypothetical protein
MKTFDIFKKRDGQGFKVESSIFASDFEEAKKIFAKNMTNDNWEKSNNIVWLKKEEDGVPATGWYDLNASILTEGEEGETDYAASQLELFCSEESIEVGFDSWSEDCYTLLGS